MRIVKDYNRIPQSCTERFIPAGALVNTIFAAMGIRIGGITTAREGFFIKRPGNRDYHILIVTISGEGIFRMEDEQTALSGPGDIYFSNAGGQGHEHLSGKKPWIFLWLQFRHECNWLIPPFTDWGIVRGNSQENAWKLHSILESILNEELYIHEARNRLQQLYAELFMLYLQRELHIPQNIRLGRHHAKLNQLWQNITTSPGKVWRLEEMSKFSGISRAQLSRVCMALYNKSPGEKVREIKLEHAQALLRHFDCQVWEVAELVGYENTSNFSAAFKKYFGYSPRETAGKGFPS
jgi:AraC-like DNA-binding protein